MFSIQGRWENGFYEKKDNTLENLILQLLIISRKRKREVAN